MKKSKLLAVLGAATLTLGVAGTALAATGSVDWTGNGVTDGQLNNVQCDDNNTPSLFWVLSPANNITAAELWVNGVDQGAMVAASDNGNAAFQLQTGWFDLDTVTASAAITYDGELVNGLKLKISHGCPGEQETEAPSATPTFGLETAGITDAPSEPTTDAIGTTGTSGPADGAWLLVVALGMLLASIVVLTPARAKR